MNAWRLKRRKAEKRFRRTALTALILALGTLVVLLSGLVTRGYHGFYRAEIYLTLPGTTQSGQDGQRPAQEALRRQFPEITDRRQLRQLYALLGSNAGTALAHQPAASGGYWLPASHGVQRFLRGNHDGLEEEIRQWLTRLNEQGALRLAFDWGFLTRSDSRYVEEAGFLGAIIGSLLTLTICLAIAFPIGVLAAGYLEEFAPKNRWNHLIEININNLAAVPSIVFGLLGLAVYLNFFGLPRSSPLVGGLTLAMIVLPVIIIATRASLKAIPPSIRQAAQALGASPMQVLLHHLLPLALPGIMTGTILGMARAIGETAPLLMIGMVAFIADIPRGFTDPATAMPVQIYLWASSPEAGFAERTAAAILVLLVMLLAMNALAIYLRKRFEVRW